MEAFVDEDGMWSVPGYGTVCNADISLPEMHQLLLEVGREINSGFEKMQALSFVCKQLKK